MNTFYISTDGNVAGPYTGSQIKRMWDSGLINSDAYYCINGTENWESLKYSFLTEEKNIQPQLSTRNASPQGFSAVQQLSVLEQSKYNDVKRLDHAAFFLSITSLAIALIPGLGLIVWVVGGFVCLAIFIISILMLSKGSMGGGIFGIFWSLLILPLLMFVTPLISSALFSSLMR